MASILLPIVQAPLATTTGVAIVAGLLYLVYQRTLPKPLPGIPYHEADAKSIFGTLPRMVTALRESNGLVTKFFSAQTILHNAPLVQIWLGPLEKPTLLLCDFQESQDILIRRQHEFDRSQTIIDGLHCTIGAFHMAMRSDDARFRGNKEIIRDLMSPRFLNEVSAPQIYSKTQNLVELWRLKASAAASDPGPESDGRAFEARADINDAVMDIVVGAAFALDDELSTIQMQLDHLRAASSHLEPRTDLNGGLDFSRGDASPEMAALRDVAAHAGVELRRPFPRFLHHFSMLSSDLRRAFALKEKVIHAQIQKAVVRVSGNVQLSATDHVVQREMNMSAKEGRAPDYFSPRIRDELYGYVVGGNDSTSSSLAWMVKHLGSNLAVQEKLRGVLKEAYHAAAAEERQPTVREIVATKIPYLDAFVEESLRHAQPSPMVDRDVMVDTVILGHHIPKGTHLIINGCGPGYLSQPVEVPDEARSESSREKTWGASWDAQDIAEFKPERWLTAEGAYNSQAGPLLSFGLGNRGCWGRKLAHLQACIAATLLVWNFRFGACGGVLGDYERRETLSAWPLHCYVKLEVLS